MSSLKIHNTLTKKKEEFIPVDDKHVRMYTCGPTVYNYAHIGNARPAVVSDLLVRILRYLYPKVTYEEVCSGNSGHSEVVKLTFDEKVISFRKILDLFFKMHDPTQKDMQFPDVGTQYRSEIFYESEEQKKEAEEVLNEINKNFDGKIQTNISKVKNYCKAEEYHQKYIEKNKG